MSHPKPLLLTAALSLATVLGYGVYRIVQTDAPAAEPGLAGAAGPAVLADSLPAFALADLDGTVTPIDSFAGRPLVINFWATWCGPCLREIPLLKTLQAEHPDIRVVGIAVDRPEPVRAFVEEMQFNYPVLVGQAEAMDAATSLGIDVFVLPSTVFTAATGETLGIHVGEIHAEHLDRLTASLAALDSGDIDVATARRQLAAAH